jgi:quaternary ammonium compound-resistance protein SugE
VEREDEPVRMLLLARATETIPLGTAWVVWVGVGAVGVALVGVELTSH